MRKINKITCVLGAIASIFCVLYFCLYVYLYLFPDNEDLISTTTLEYFMFSNVVAKRICIIVSVLILRKSVISLEIKENKLLIALHTLNSILDPVI